MIDLDYKLVDDDTLTGGTSFCGETLRDFLDSIRMGYNTPLPVINKALKECGIITSERGRLRNENSMCIKDRV